MLKFHRQDSFILRLFIDKFAAMANGLCSILMELPSWNCFVLLFYRELISIHPVIFSFCQQLLELFFFFFVTDRTETIILISNLHVKEDN